MGFVPELPRPFRNVGGSTPLRPPLLTTAWTEQEQRSHGTAETTSSRTHARPFLRYPTGVLAFDVSRGEVIRPPTGTDPKKPRHPPYRSSCRPTRDGDRQHGNGTSHVDAGAGPQSRDGFDGQTTTKEYTKILTDGHSRPVRVFRNFILPRRPRSSRSSIPRRTRTLYRRTPVELDGPLTLHQFCVFLITGSWSSRGRSGCRPCLHADVTQRSRATSACVSSPPIPRILTSGRIVALTRWSPPGDFSLIGCVTGTRSTWRHTTSPSVPTRVRVGRSSTLH